MSASTARKLGVKNWNVSNGALNGSIVTLTVNGLTYTCCGYCRKSAAGPTAQPGYRPGHRRRCGPNHNHRRRGLFRFSRLGEPCLRLAYDSPATVIGANNKLGARTLPRISRSSPMRTIFFSISRKLPAIVNSSTGWAITPSSTQKPAAPRE